MKKIGVISPQDWGLAVNKGEIKGVEACLGIPAGDVEQRIKAALYQWLPHQFSKDEHAYYGYYRATDHYREPPQTVNLIITWALMAGFDRYGDASLLELAGQALDYYYQTFVVSHPMSIVRGGARDGAVKTEIWTKFSAEFAIGALGYYQRSGKAEWLERAEQSGRYLVQAARHGFATKYRLDADDWIGTAKGWDSWGRVIEACLLLEQVSGNERWLHLAARWGEHALQIQKADGAFCLINGEYYNTDLAADELRGLLFLYERTGDEHYLKAGVRFADWHVDHQQPNGAWQMTIDADGDIVVPTVGPGDVPNIAVALLRAYQLTGKPEYFQSASQAFQYSLGRQVLPGSGQPYADDPNVQWGFWSWDPYYDYTVSGDQVTHHVRGLMFYLDFMGGLV